MIRRTYSLRGSYIELVSEWDAAAEWADLCLTPYVSIGGGQMRVATFACYYGREAPAPPAVEPRPVRMHLRRDAQAYATDEHHLTIRMADGVVYRVDGSSVEAFYPAQTEDSLRDPARHCREILYNSLPADSWYNLHASALAKEGRAIVFTGPGGAGKTTAICHLLSRTHHDGLLDFVSNDQVWLEVGGGRMHIIGSPLPIRIGYGTMASIPELAPNLSLFRDRYQIIMKNWAGKAHEYSAREFTGFFGCDINTEAEVIAVVQLKPGTSNLLLPVEDDAERVRVIRRAASDNESTYPNWMRIGAAPSERSLDKIDAADVTCPVYEMEFTPSETAIMKCDEAVINALGNLMS